MAHRRTSCAVAGVLLAALAGGLAMLARVPAERMPQTRAGGGILSVLLGDAKRDLSGAMVQMAESYFHGGVDVDCHHHGHHEEAEDAERGHAHEHGHGGHGKETHGGGDPWRWINDHVRAPEVDRHLDTGDVREMLPWYWLATRSDPHNVEAWTTTWYAAAYLMKDPVLGLKIAEEALRNNPESLEAACIVGRTCLMKGLEDESRAVVLFERVRAQGVARLAGGTARLSEREGRALLLALDQLSARSPARDDRRELAALLEEARRVDPDHAVVDRIERRLKKTPR